MVRPNRWVTRVGLMLVIVMGLVGYWVAGQWINVDLSQVQTQQPADEGAWVELLATLGEEALQLFLGFTSD